MQLLSVNVGAAQPIQNAKFSGKTGIFKQPQRDGVYIGTLGLAGDAICDTENHGGVDQAVYAYTEADYQWWSAELGKTLAPGTFGENLTIAGLDAASIQIGDRLRVGKVLLEVTAPRIPCVTLAVRMDDPAFLKRWRRAERSGLYCRVIEDGMVRAGDPVTLIPYMGETFTAVEMFRQFFRANEVDIADVQRALAAPIDIRSRRWYEEKLLELEAQ